MAQLGRIHRLKPSNLEYARTVKQQIEPPTRCLIEVIHCSFYFPIVRDVDHA